VANLIVSAVSTFDNKGLKKGQKEIGAFDKQVNKLGKTFAGVFGAAAILNYSKKAISAFMADEKAAKSLELQLKNTGYAFSAPAVEDYIGKLQKTTGVLDDELRPSFQRLLTVTKSITQSQDALALALDLSAAGYGSVEQISASLAKAYSGQTTALGRLGTGLSKATLATGNMEKIMAELQQKFAGQAAARLTTYAGKMDLLKVASENVKEEIGKGILGALDALGKDTSIEDTTGKMENFGKATGDAITGVGVLIAELQKIPGSKRVTDVLFGTNIFGLLGKLAEEENKSKAGTKANLEPRAASRVYLQQLKLENKIIKEGNKARADELAKLKAKSEVDKLKDKFDVERIGLTLALNQATDEETKLRLRAQLAILDNNEAMAKKLNIDLDAAAKAKALADALAKAALAADSFSNFAMGAVQRGEYADVYRNISNVPTQSAGGAMQLPSAATFAMGGVSRGEYAPVTVNVAGSVLTEQDLTNTINETLLRINKMGRGTTPAGGLSGGT
jgi:hypothetical protein